MMAPSHRPRSRMVPLADLPSLFDLAARKQFALFPALAWHKSPKGVRIGGRWISHKRDWFLDPKVWRAWYDELGGCNFGVECGPSKAIVVDVDTDPSGRPYFDDLWAKRAATAFSVRTPRNGWHLYYRVPDGFTAPLGSSPWEKGRIDIRAGAAYPIAPYCWTDPKHDPSVKRMGRYEIVDPTREIEIAPPDLLEFCEKESSPEIPQRAPGAVAFGSDGFPVDAMLRAQGQRLFEGYIADLRRAVPGERNHALNVAAFLCGALARDELVEVSVAHAALSDAAAEIGLERVETRQTISSGLRSGLRLGTGETRNSALMSLLAAPVPTVVRPFTYKPKADDRVLAEPVVERLLYEGWVTIMSGASGSGKTTVGASLMAASVAGARNFTWSFESRSDAIVRPASWIFVSYEGGQMLEWHHRAWHVGTEQPAVDETRRRILSPRGPLIGQDARRNVWSDQGQMREIAQAIEDARRARPDLPVVVAIDNITSACQLPTEMAQAQGLMAQAKWIADQGTAVLLFAHPPKAETSSIFGSMVYFAMSDIVAVLEVLRREKDEWLQWMEFHKHRQAVNGKSLELRSRRLAKPIIDLPAEWGGLDTGRARALEDLKLPFLASIRVRYDSEKEQAKARVEAVREKPVVSLQLVPKT